MEAVTALKILNKPSIPFYNTACIVSKKFTPLVVCELEPSM